VDLEDFINAQRVENTHAALVEVTKDKAAIKLVEYEFSGDELAYPAGIDPSGHGKAEHHRAAPGRGHIGDKGLELLAVPAAVKFSHRVNQVDVILELDPESHGISPCTSGSFFELTYIYKRQRDLLVTLWNFFAWVHFFVSR
jgi:hypothetical protein